MNPTDGLTAAKIVAAAGVLAAAAALSGCAGSTVAVNAPDGSNRGFCQTGLFAAPTLCFVRAAPGEAVVRAPNGAEDAAAFLSGAGDAAAGAGGLLFGARYRPDVSITDASAPTTMQGARTTVEGSRNTVSLSARANSHAAAQSRAVARQRQAETQRQHEVQAQRQRQAQLQRQHQNQEQRQHQNRPPTDNKGW